jgi:hypothetical protein
VGTQAGDCTAPNSAPYYLNNTKIYGPPQNPSDSQPWCEDCSFYGTPTTGLVYTAENATLYGLADHWAGSEPLASSYLKDWLGDSGHPVKISVSQLMDQLPGFYADVQQAIAQCEVRGKTTGYCSGTWQTADVPSSDGNYYNAIGPSFNYRVYGYKDSSGKWNWTVQVYKYYAFIAPIEYVLGGMGTRALDHFEENGWARNFIIWGQESFIENPSHCPPAGARGPTC